MDCDCRRYIWRVPLIFDKQTTLQSSNSGRKVCEVQVVAIKQLHVEDARALSEQDRKV